MQVSPASDIVLVDSRLGYQLAFQKLGRFVALAPHDEYQMGSKFSIDIPPDAFDPSGRIPDEASEPSLFFQLYPLGFQTPGCSSEVNLLFQPYLLGF